jgi:hypothetical protein
MLLSASHPHPLTQVPSCAPALAHASSLDTDRTRNARARAPTSPRSTGICAIWDCISSSFSLTGHPGVGLLPRQYRKPIHPKPEVRNRNGDRGAFRGTPGSAYPQPEPNATELPSSAPGHPKSMELQASAPSPTPTRAEEHIATTPDFGPRAPAPSPTPTRTEHLPGLQIVRICALARRRAPKRTSHYTCCCGRGTLHVKR